MYKCLVDSLTRPKKIAEHINMKTFKFIFYFLLLSLISTIPNIVIYCCDTGISEKTASLLVSDLQSYNDSYEYQVVDNTLNGNASKCFEVSGIGSVLGYNNQVFSTLKTFVFFNPTDERVDTLDEKNPYIAINLGSKTLEISIETPSTSSDKQEMSNNLVSFKYTYEELNVGNIDFSEIHSYSTYGISLKLEKIIDVIIKPYLPMVYLIGIPLMFVINAFSMAFEILLISAVVFFFFRTSQLKFMEFLKLITLSMTPSAVVSIFLLLPLGTMGYYTIYFIGQILTISYFYKALRQLYINKMMK